MNLSSTVSHVPDVVTTESRAKQLGARIQFLKYCTIAYDFPTHGHAFMFLRHLLDIGYNARFNSDRCVAYSAPSAVHQLCPISG